jgi:hypothetical protein
MRKFLPCGDINGKNSLPTDKREPVKLKYFYIVVNAKIDNYLSKRSFVIQIRSF